jgi:hypothetical protein
MNNFESLSARAAGYELRFRPLRSKGSCLAFPCNDRGCVDLDALGDRALRNYLYARAVIGFEFASPSVVRLAH